jgi:signal transduction histidine kinase
MHGDLELALREEPLPAERREHLLSLRDEVQRLSKIVDALTLLTRADAGQVALNRELLQLDDLVRDTHADALILAEPGGIRVELPACEPCTVAGDRHRLRQLFLNLVDNAVKYNVRGGFISMELRASTGTAEFTITNSGPGIPGAVLPRVFDRFFRGDPAHAGEVEGSGLGLSIAQWIASAHNGTIEIASGASKPTTVTVRLPLAAGADTPSPA